MTVMLRKAMRDLRASALWFGLGGAAYAAGVLAYYPSVRDNASIDAFLKTYPKSLIEALGITDFSSFTGFLGAEVLNLMWPLVMAVFAILAGSALVAREIETGTIETWLSVPASRSKLLGAKLLALAGVCTAIPVLSVLAIVAMAARFGVTLDRAGVASMALEMIGYMLVLALGTGFLSSVLSDRGRAAGIAGGLTVLSYAALLISRLASGWEWTSHLSLFSIYRPQQALETAQFDLGALGIMAGVAIAAAGAALLAFQRRDAIA